MVTDEELLRAQAELDGLDAGLANDSAGQPDEPTARLKILKELNALTREHGDVLEEQTKISKDHTQAINDGTITPDQATEFKAKNSELETKATELAEQQAELKEILKLPDAELEEALKRREAEAEAAKNKEGPKPDEGVDAEEKLRADAQRKAAEAAAKPKGEEEADVDDGKDTPSRDAGTPKAAPKAEELDAVTAMLVSDLKGLQDGSVSYNDFVGTLNSRLEGLDPASALQHLFSAVLESFTTNASPTSSPKELANAYVGGMSDAMNKLPVSMRIESEGSKVGRATGIDLSDEQIKRISDFAEQLKTETENNPDVDPEKALRPAIGTSGARSALQLIDDIENNKANINNCTNEDGVLKVAKVGPGGQAADESTINHLGREFAERLGLKGDDHNAFLREFRDECNSGIFQNPYKIDPDEVRGALEDAIDATSKSSELSQALDQADKAVQMAEASSGTAPTPS